MLQQDHEQLIWAYRTMQTIRYFEERMHVEFATGKVPGFVHLYAGQEASATGICANLSDTDYFHITHRAHGPAIARGADVNSVAKEIYCRADGLCRGKGGSAHLHDTNLKLVGANGGVGSGAALACGSALAIRHRQSSGVAIALLGEGSCNQGIVSESLNLASIWKLPVVFAFENNGYGEATASSYAIAGNNLTGRGPAFDMPAVDVNGHDYFAVYDAVHTAVEKARSGAGPSLLNIEMTRYFGHYEGDSQKYRSADEVETCRRERDCIASFRQRLVDDQLLSIEEFNAIDSEIDELINEAYEKAMTSPLPDSSTLHTDMFV